MRFICRLVFYHRNFLSQEFSIFFLAIRSTMCYDNGRRGVDFHSAGRWKSVSGDEKKSVLSDEGRQCDWKKADRLDPLQKKDAAQGKGEKTLAHPECQARGGQGKAGPQTAFVPDAGCGGSVSWQRVS